MFDYTKLNETVETFTAKADDAVSTAIVTGEANTMKMVGYIQDHNVRTIAEAYAEAGFALTRAIVDANRGVAETVKKAFVS